jgi:16S rRNA (guanine527-N7)-methyltransferase
LAIIDPEREVSLIDSAGKKIWFICHVSRMLKLGNIHLVLNWTEEMNETVTYSNITSRAFVLDRTR